MNIKSRARDNMSSLRSMQKNLSRRLEELSKMLVLVLFLSMYSDFYNVICKVCLNLVAYLFAIDTWQNITNIFLFSVIYETGSIFIVYVCKSVFHLQASLNQWDRF